jgi:hypothetical protein
MYIGAHAREQGSGWRAGAKRAAAATAQPATRRTLSNTRQRWWHRHGSRRARFGWSGGVVGVVCAVALGCRRQSHTGASSLGSRQVHRPGSALFSYLILSALLCAHLYFRYLQVVNNYDLDVFNGDIGFVTALNEDDETNAKPTATVEFAVGGRQKRTVVYEGRGELRQLLPAWAITVHKAQGSEYEVVILPVTLQHWFVLSRNLLYTALTRSQALCIVVGERKAMHAALGRTDGDGRWTGLKQQLQRQVTPN